VREGVNEIERGKKAHLILFKERSSSVSVFFVYFLHGCFFVHLLRVLERISLLSSYWYSIQST
jgi:hypothetical protein